MRARRGEITEEDSKSPMRQNTPGRKYSERFFGTGVISMAGVLKFPVERANSLVVTGRAGARRVTARPISKA
jgi:hypothetical protein